MKFVHTADLHLDSKFETLNQIEDLPQKRRLEQRQAINQIIEYVKQNHAELLIISGDLYEQNYIRRSSIDYLNNLFSQIPETQIVISPGNHDPYIKNSFYATYPWSPNVHIFSKVAEKFDFKDIHIYGMAFTDFYCRDSKIEEIKIEEPQDINLLVAHASLDAAKDPRDYRDYNPVKKAKLEEMGFDYIALGHIHKPSYNEEINQTIIYPGSPLSLGFDEQGQHGFVAGEIEKGKIKVNFIEINQRQFKEIDIDVTELTSNEDVIEKIDEIPTNDDDLYKINLTGKRYFTIKKDQIRKICTKSNIVKIKDKTKTGKNIEEIAKEQSVRGIFVRNMLEKKDTQGLDDEYIEKTIELGLEVLEWK